MIGVVLLGGVHGSLAAARSFGRAGVPVAYFAPKFSPASLSRYMTHIIAWAGVDEPDPVARLVGEAKARGLEGWLLLPADDFSVELVARHREVLDKTFLVDSMDWPALEHLNDKGALSTLAARLGLSTPQVYPADVDSAQLAYPVVIKPKFTKARNALTRAKAWRSDDVASFRAQQAEALALTGRDGFVVQQLIPGAGDVQASYAAIWDYGRELHCMTALRMRQYPLEFGVSPYVVAQPMPRVADEARKLLSAVGYHGLVEVEFKLDRRDDTLKLLDVNTRIWAWLGLGAACGIDFAALALALAKGEPLPPAGPPIPGVWRRYMPSLFSLAADIRRHGRPGLAGWQSIGGRAHGALWSNDDLKPALSEIPLKAAQILF